MAAIPDAIDADRGPPMAVPLQHFVVALVFLLAGTVAGVAGQFGLLAGMEHVAFVHLLFVGWVCITILGAMTQFVPVWSGLDLHSRRLAKVQLLVVTVGLAGLVAALFSGAVAWLAATGTVLAVGIWLFVYNIGRTLAAARPWDVTERHFAFALGCFVAVTMLALPLAVGFSRPVFTGLPVTHESVRMAHASVAVFGAVLTTVLGALYQLATMFTQTELHGIDTTVRRAETVAYPVGVTALVVGRLFETVLLARLGGVLVAGCIIAVGFVVARRLYETQVDQTPMLSRYAVVAVAMVIWGLLALPAWAVAPLAAGTLYGAEGTFYLLAFGVISFVVLGTLYHIVPFLIWVDRYSGQLGLADVPMIDDLYSDRLAVVDFTLLSGGVVALVIADSLAVPSSVLFFGSLLVLAGGAVFVANVTLVVRRHNPGGVRGLVSDTDPAAGSPEQSD